MIDTYLLEQVLAFYETGTLSAASETLLISQPALSQSMKKLEDIVGVPLFNRSKNKTTFNENGLLLVDYAQKILNLQDQMVREVRQKALHHSTLRLVSVAPAPLMKFVPLLKQNFPQMDLRQDLLTEEIDLVTGLLEGDYDLAIGTQVPDDDRLIALPFFQETLLLQVPLNHPLARYESLSEQELDGQNFLLFSEIGFWMAHVKTLLPKANFLYMDNMQAFSNLATIGDFPTFVSNALPYDGTNPDRKLIPITGQLAQAQFYILVLKNEAYKWQTVIASLQALSDEDEKAIMS